MFDQGFAPSKGGVAGASTALKKISLFWGHQALRRASVGGDSHGALLFSKRYRECSFLSTRAWGRGRAMCCPRSHVRVGRATSPSNLQKFEDPSPIHPESIPRRRERCGRPRPLDFRAIEDLRAVSDLCTRALLKRQEPQFLSFSKSAADDSKQNRSRHLQDCAQREK